MMATGMPGQAVLKEEEMTSSQISTDVLRLYLLKRVPIFRRLMKLKEMGRNNPAGDVHFRRQRERADTANDGAQHMFFNMMIQLGDELDAATGAFSQLGVSGNKDDSEQINVLDLCMAPGGFTASILKNCPTAQVSGLSLPLANGGHKMRARNGGSEPRVRVEYLDITMLTADLYPKPSTYPSSASHGKGPLIPKTHPRAHLFIPDTRPYFTSPPIFDLVVCDGQVLRTHSPALPKNGSEPTRLDCAQLVLALTRLRPGGTLVILLHRPDSWNCARLIRAVDAFSSGPVRLFKSVKKHADRSSFYLVAKGVQPDDRAAKQAVEMWRRAWLAATLRMGKEGGNLTEWSDWEKGGDLHEFFNYFGARLIELAEPIWQIQADALEKAPYIRNQCKEGK